MHDVNLSNYKEINYVKYMMLYDSKHCFTNTSVVTIYNHE